MVDGPCGRNFINLNDLDLSMGHTCDLKKSVHSFGKPWDGEYYVVL